MRFKLEAKNPLTENVQRYLECFGHLPSIEAFKFATTKELDRIAKEAVQKGVPIKEWETRAQTKYGTSLDEYYEN